MPKVGDVLLLKKATVNKFDGGSLNAYDNCEMVVNLDRRDFVGLREWWELRQLEEDGCLDLEECLDV